MLITKKETVTSYQFVVDDPIGVYLYVDVDEAKVLGEHENFLKKGITASHIQTVEHTYETTTDVAHEKAIYAFSYRDESGNYYTEMGSQKDAMEKYRQKMLAEGLSVSEMKSHVFTF